ncbi:MAG: hypothetical protein KAH18_10215 [Psychromonas sp.]|nr:hypothetical protein [Psychromonas sp.]
MDDITKISSIMTWLCQIKDGPYEFEHAYAKYDAINGLVQPINDLLNNTNQIYTIADLRDPTYSAYPNIDISHIADSLVTERDFLRYSSLSNFYARGGVGMPIYLRSTFFNPNNNATQKSIMLYTSIAMLLRSQIPDVLTVNVDEAVWLFTCIKDAICHEQKEIYRAKQAIALAVKHNESKRKMEGNETIKFMRAKYKIIQSYDKCMN